MGDLLSCRCEFGFNVRRINHPGFEAILTILLLLGNDYPSHPFRLEFASEHFVAERLLLCHIAVESMGGSPEHGPLGLISYFVSRCRVCLRRAGLYFLSSILPGVLRRFFMVEYREVPGASVQSKITLIRTSFPLAMTILVYADYILTPFLRASFSTAEMPFLLIVLIVWADTRSVTQRFSSGT